MSGNKLHKNSDLISVIIPAYNHEKYVGHTIDSLVSQTYSNIELIILNDGSTDNSNEIIKKKLAECKTRFFRTEYINKENEGIIKTLNKGLSLANGKYIHVIASDDSDEPDAIETLHSFLSQNQKYGLAVGDNFIMDHNGKRCFWNEELKNVYSKDQAKYLTFGKLLRFYRKDVDFNSDDFGSYKSLLKGNYIPNGYLIRKEIFDKIGGYSEDSPLEDYYLMMQITKISKLKFIDKPLFNYRCHSTNTSKKTDYMERITFKTFIQEKTYAKKNGYGDFFHEEHYGIPFLLQVVYDEKLCNIKYRQDYVIILGIKFAFTYKKYRFKEKSIKVPKLSIYRRNG